MNTLRIIKLTTAELQQVEQQRIPMQLAEQTPSRQHVYTPEGLAADVVRAAGLRSMPGASVLEPCFGSGALIRAALAVQSELAIVGYELDFNTTLDSFCTLECDLISVRSRDFLRVRPAPVDVVIMHPPRELDIEMVSHALRFVRDGGKLVAVMGTAWQVDESPNAQRFRAELSMHPHSVTRIKPGVFKGSGDMEGATMLTARVAGVRL